MQCFKSGLSAAYALYWPPAETEKRTHIVCVKACAWGRLWNCFCGLLAAAVLRCIQCLCPALNEARIRANHNLCQRLWKGIRTATRGWILVEQQTPCQTMAGLKGLLQPEELIDSWQRAWDEITDVQLEGGDRACQVRS